MKKGSGAYWYTTSTGKRKRTKSGIKHEYQKFQSSTSAIKDRSSRNSARRSAMKKGLVKVHDGKSVDHRDSNPRDNRPSNLKVMSRSANAARREDSRAKGSKRNKKNMG